MSNTGFAFTLTVCIFSILVGGAWLIDSFLTYKDKRVDSCKAAGGIYFRATGHEICIKKEAVIPL